MMKAWIQRYARWIACVGIGCVCMVLGFVLGGVWSSRQAAAGVTVPILTPAANMQDALERFRSEREQERKQDRASLEKLIDSAAVEEQTRQDAAEALTRLVEWNQQELALEGALTKTRLTPCIAVRSEGAVTIVTEKAELSEGESALLLTLCETHAGVPPEGVKVICAAASGE